jgi:hypothetical protein
MKLYWSLSCLKLSYPLKETLPVQVIGTFSLPVYNQVYKI